MKIQRNFYTWAVATLAIILLIVSSLSGGSPSVFGAPAAVPTPITQYPFNPRPALVEFWAPGSTITADGHRCVDSAGYSTVDLHYIFDQTTVNTTTLTIEYSNMTTGGYTDALLYPDGIAIVSANAADAADMKQFPVFGAKTCVDANVTNSNSLGLGVVGLFK